jgi:O-antigen/teichoic acid export membrane protein
VVAEGGGAGIGAGGRPVGAGVAGSGLSATDGALVELATTRRAVVARSAWSFIGQGLSSSSNFILSVLVLSQGSPAQFATLSIVLTIYTFFLLLLRAAVGLPVTLLYSKDLARGREEELRAAAGVTAAASIVVAVAVLLWAVASSSDRGQWLVLGALLPMLLLQDTARYACFALGRPRAAAEADGLWVIVQVVGSAAVLLAVEDAGAATALLGVWAGAGALSGGFLLARTGLPPSLGHGYRWLHTHRRLAGRLVTDYLVGAGSHYAVFFTLAVVAGSGELGRLKAAQTFLGPLIVLLLGGAVFGVPESVRAGGDPARLWRLTLRLAGALVAAALVCGAVVYLALPAVGPATFPDAWESARPALPLLTVFAAAVGASTGSTSGLRAMDQNSWLLRVRFLVGPVLVLASIPACAAWGVNGALAALSLTEWAVVVLSWRRLRAVLGAGV